MSDNRRNARKGGAWLNWRGRRLWKRRWWWVEECSKDESGSRGWINVVGFEHQMDVIESLARPVQQRGEQMNSVEYSDGVYDECGMEGTITLSIKLKNKCWAEIQDEDGLKGAKAIDDDEHDN